VKLWRRPVDFDANQPGDDIYPMEDCDETIFFVRRDVLLEHPSWKGTPAATAYAEAVLALTEEIGDVYAWMREMRHGSCPEPCMTPTPSILAPLPPTHLSSGK